MKELYLVPVFTNQTKSMDFSLLRKTVKSKIAHSVSVLLQPFGTQCAHSGDSGLPQSSFPGNQAQHLSSGPMALNCLGASVLSLNLFCASLARGVLRNQKSLRELVGVAVLGLKLGVI